EDRQRELSAVYENWQTRFQQWQSKHPERAKRLSAQVAKTMPNDLREQLLAALPEAGKAVATRKLSGAVIQAASKAVPALIGGSADLEPSTNTLIKGSSDVTRESFSGKNLRFGVREHAMGAIMNGLAYYGPFIPYGSTFLCFSDYMRPAIRLAALSRLPGLFIFTHDSIFLGEDGPTHQAVEHLNALRLIPNLFVLRPADGYETAISYEIALRRMDGPCALIFSRQNVPPIEHRADFDPEAIYRGGYVLFESGTPDVVFVATGSEVPLAISAAKKLAGSIGVRVVSMPCVELFLQQDEAYREQTVPSDSKLVIIEAGRSTGWVGMLRPTCGGTLMVGVDRFGASAPYEELVERFGFTPEAVVARVRSEFGL
ncbi:MAG: transketolase, partial [Bdellovibrionales bacterium]|nr:transketolase [Bdellovibrionales bacterium]